MKKFLSFIWVFIITVISVNPCTTFVLKTTNDLVFGRNLDWISDMGLVVINKRNVAKQSLVFAPESSINWASKYGSISFNQFGKEFPFGGINEKGLVVEIMISEAEYPAMDERPVVNELQWIQYQLDNCATIDEVIATDPLLRIGQTHEQLHFLLCDAFGNTAVIEFLEGKMVVYKNTEIPVLENDPYKKSLENFGQKKDCRFTDAANLIKKYDENGQVSPIDYSFNILEEVAWNSSWSIVYDIKNMQVHFKTQTNEEIQIVDINYFDFHCDAGDLMYDLGNKYKGNIDELFVKLNAKKNTTIVDEAINVNGIILEPEQLKKFENYYKECACKE